MMTTPLPATGFAFGKVILSGEHSVVYGHPALVVATQLGSKAEATEVTSVPPTEALPQTELIERFTLRIKELFSEKFSVDVSSVSLDIKTDLPIQSGMGSSASMAAAAFRALAQYTQTELTNEQFFDLVQTSEREFHGNPSGVDASAVIYGGAMVFQKDDASFERQMIGIDPSAFPSFLLIQSGRPKESTKEMVAFVAERAEEDQTKEILEKIAKVTLSMIAAVKERNHDQLLLLVDKNELLLEQLDVVSKQTQRLIREIQGLGGSAKISGAGGRTAGSGIILAFHPDTSQLKAFCDEHHLTYLQTELAQGGQL
ncbi:mevalonate kinase [Patescibacteria group bacterium]|nr:mevalonate kinase [Patescibacteria group bacterium]